MAESNQHPRSPASRVSIDGSRVKYLRESRGLTQLYIATFLGVTTDTVSRWENKKYPTVKWENVEKLAEALEVDVEEIIDTSGDEAEQDEPVQAPAEPVQVQQNRKPLFLAVTVVALLLLGFILYNTLNKKEPVNITATRYLPKHIPAGQPFPVVIRVEAAGVQSFSFILQEKLPPQFRAIKGIPEIASIDTGSNTVKWISSSQASPFFLAYFVQASPDREAAGTVTFSGQIKADRAPRFEQDLAGDSSAEVSDFHWADANSDGVIDDEEILMVYSSAEVLENLGVNMEQIREIWSAKGYTWNPKENEYQVHR